MSQVKPTAPTAGAPNPQAAGIDLDFDEFPYWLVGMVLVIGALAAAIIFTDSYREAFVAVLPGLSITIVTTVTAFVIALVVGLVLGLGRMVRYEGTNQLLRALSVGVRNLSTLYVELVRGIPFIVFIFLVASVFTRDIADLLGTETRAIRFVWRGVAALSLFYAAFIAEVIRAGIQSVSSGQREAGRAVGLNARQVMRHIILPQAIRNTLPALGNDLIALMKDTALLSILAVRELTQYARLYVGSSFRLREGYYVLTIFYVVLTLLLSLLLRWYERRIQIPGEQH